MENRLTFLHHINKQLVTFETFNERFKMNPPSLLHLSLLPLSAEQTIEICSSDQFPSCDEIWKAKAQLDFGFSSDFFDFFLDSSGRSLNNFQRYLELSLVNSFLPQAGEDLIEGIAGVKDAVLKGSEDQLNFFLFRLCPKAKVQLAEILNSSSKLKSLFPQGPDLISFSVFDSLVYRLTGQSLKDEKETISASQLWLIEEKSPGPLEIKIRNQMAYCGAIPQKELLENWDFFPIDILCYLIEKGNEQALEKVLSFTRMGRFGFTFGRVFVSILRSGRIDFINAFRPYLKYLNSLADQPSEKPVPNSHYYFTEAFYGGNPKFIEFLNEIGKLTLEDKLKSSSIFTAGCLRSAFEGFLFHRNLEATCQMVEQIPELNFSLICAVDFSSLPVDVIDYVYRKISTKDHFSPSAFFAKILSENLGYLNVVDFCLEKLREFNEKSPDVLKKVARDEVLQYQLNKYSDLTPISVEKIRSALKF